MANLQRDYSRLSGTIFERSKTKDLRLLVAGAGALGNEIIKNLSLIGVGSILIVDCDTVEASNLTRSILFSTSDIERHILNKEPKATLAAARAREINSDVKMDAFVGEVADLGLGRFKEFDIVFSALDNEMARLELSWACLSTNRLLVDGGLGFQNYSSGLLSIYPGADGPCYACRKSREHRSALLTTLQGWRFPCSEREQEAEANDFVTTTPLMASIIAAIQVEEGMRAFVGGRSPSEGRSLEVTLHPNPRLARFSYVRNRNCPLHDIPSRCHQWPRNSAATTVSELLDFVERLEHAKPSLTLRWPIVVSAHCQDCGTTWAPMVRAARFRREKRCSACGSEHVIEGEPLSEIRRESPWADKNLRELSLPDNHVHEFVIHDNGEKRLIAVEIRD